MSRRAKPSGVMAAASVVLAFGVGGLAIGGNREAPTSGRDRARQGPTAAAETADGGTAGAMPRPEVPDDAPAPRVLPPGVPPTTPAARVTRGPYESIQVNLDADGLNIVGDAANEPSLAVAPTDPDRMAIGWRQFDTVVSNFRQAGWAYSHDGGQTWTFPGVLDPGQFRSDPVLDTDADGNFYYYSLSGAFEGWECELFKSYDAGVSWPQMASAFGGDKAWMVVDKTDGIGRGNVYAIWQRYYNCCGANTFTRSTDGGLTFEQPLHIPQNPTFGTLAVGPSGEVYAAGLHNQHFGDFVVARSNNAQDPAAAPTFVTVDIDMGGTMRFSTGPNPAGLLAQAWVAVDHSPGLTHGNVYVLCSVNPPGSDPLDVMFTRSVDGGLTWSAPKRINDDPPGNGAWQWFGTMSVAPSGRIDVIWNDTRNTGAVNLSELYYAYSTDGGLSWSENVPVSPVFDSFLGWPNQNKLGDYYTMISDDAGADVAYAATFNGEQDVYYVRIFPDCNDNEVPDLLDVENGTSEDCNTNSVPDECEDCNGNGLADECDLAGGTSGDCNSNGLPDECEDCNTNGVPDECEDCNGNGLADECDLAGGTSGDCNSNGLPDECEDCNTNGLADECDIDSGTSDDCNSNATPDECEPDQDCNSNGALDVCDVDGGTSQDCNGNIVPDECEADEDCNSNGVRDICDIGAGTSQDCDDNGVPDECEPDCNSNGVADGCDLVEGTSSDINSSGVPDECEAILYVDASAVRTSDGLTWGSAFSDLQDALALAAASPGVVEEIWVAADTYTPAPPGGDRAVSFQLPDGVGVYGGFAGWEMQRHQRDPATNVTVLSGDLDGDDGPDFANNAENSYHVVAATGPDVIALLDGFVITGGHANAPPLHHYGAGLRNFDADLTLVSCAFVANAAGMSAGGMFNNHVARLTNCTFAGNVAGYSGGAMVNALGDLVLANCLFTGNFAALHGGGMYNSSTALTLNNCTFSDNEAHWGEGGATFTTSSSCVFSNSIFWGNRDGGGTDEYAQITTYGGTMAVNYSCVQGWTGALGGSGNIAGDPLFWDADGADDVGGTEDDDLHLRFGSPCIDAGDDTAVPADLADLDGDGDTVERTPLDLGGKVRFVNDPHTEDTGLADPPDYTQVVDMGAYEFLPSFLDIKPGSCPNPLNRRSHGFLPVALVGSQHFDVTTVDVSSVLLSRADGVGGEVAPNEGPPGPHSVFEDVATPLEDQPCNCHQEGEDGTTDLSMKFKTDDVVQALLLNGLPGGATVDLALTGRLLDGTAFEARDCITIVPHGSGTEPGAGVSPSNNVGSESMPQPAGNAHSDPSQAPSRPGL
ncbi:MAG: hypothetical protein ACYSUI_03695 [Planctomycetota bacterium]|jgi:hypothetical protein